MDLFDYMKKKTQENEAPLAMRMRPATLDEFVGQEHIIGKGKLLYRAIRADRMTSVILYGPPGTGKTTLARVIANTTNAEFRLGGYGKRTILFIDEIHRFNKAQQDAFLPHVESGLITLIGATTENPSFEVISPLLSRSRVVVVAPLAKLAILEVLKRACKVEKVKIVKKLKNETNVAKNTEMSVKITQKALELIAELSGGDARSALGDLELALSLTNAVDERVVLEAAGRKMPGYDKKGDKHYDTISAFIKSMRGSDVDAALYYLARMVEAGEDPKFIARRMVIFASEDIGLAGNGALSLATACFQAVERVGMPESGLILAHATVALAKSKKSRATTDAWYKALEVARKSRGEPVPVWLRNAPTKLMKDLGYGKGQKWEAGFHLNKNYLPDSIKNEKLFGI